MGRLGEITFRLPRTAESGTFLRQLTAVLGEVPYAAVERGGDRLVLTPPRPSDARPVTAFAVADVPAPEVAFDTGGSVGVPGGGTPVGHRVPMAELVRRLSGYVRRVDHTGVNLPTGTTTAQRWRDLVGTVAAVSTTYRYPTGEPWPFVLPSTADELAGDIRAFVVGREPRFELVHDPWLTRTTWQFALWTDLTRPELERLFPEPDGFTLVGLEDIFRSVPVEAPWPGLDIRFDLCYRIGDGPSDWETGEWLVTDGGRIR